MNNRDARAEINLGAIRHNITEIRRHIQAAAKLCVVVKANAYGHGAVEVSKVAVECGADVLAVATVDEGLELRRAGFTLPILILGLIPTSAVEVAVKNNLTMTVSDIDFAKKISAAAVKLGDVAKIHLAIETGMGRIGVYPSDAVEVAAQIYALPGVELEGLFTHFADADISDKTFTLNQLATFKNVWALTLKFVTPPNLPQFLKFPPLILIWFAQVSSLTAFTRQPKSSARLNFCP